MNLHPQQSRSSAAGGENGVYFITLQQINGNNHLSDGDGLPFQSWLQRHTAHSHTHSSLTHTLMYVDTCTYTDTLNEPDEVR